MISFHRRDIQLLNESLNNADYDRTTLIHNEIAKLNINEFRN